MNSTKEYSKDRFFKGKNEKDNKQNKQNNDRITFPDIPVVKSRDSSPERKLTND